jgi:hypothetical protein
LLPSVTLLQFIIKGEMMKQVKSQAKMQKSINVKTHKSSASDTAMKTPLMQLRAKEHGSTFGSGVAQMHSRRRGDESVSEPSSGYSETAADMEGDENTTETDDAR